MPGPGQPGDLLAERARACPEAVAVAVDGGAALTFASWDAAADAAAGGLAARGVEPGDRVALVFGTAQWCEFAVATVAVQRAGAIAVPAAPSFLPAELERLVDASRPSLVVTAPGLLPPNLPVAVVPLAALAAAGRPEVARRAAPPGAPAAILCPGGPLTAPRPVPFPRDDPGLGLGAVFDGRPDGERRLAHCFVPGTAAAQRALAEPLRPAGATILAVPRLDAARLTRAVAEAGAVGLTGAMARVLLSWPGAAALDLAPVQAVVLADPLPPPLLARLATLFPNAHVVPAAPGPEPAPPPAPGAAPSPLAPAGFAQEGMLWYEELQPGVFTMTPFVRRMRGALDVAALERALAEIVRRHEPFRTTFRLDGGRPVQVVGEAGLALPVADLAHLPAGQRQQEARQAVAEATTRPLDPATSPPFRARLLRLAADDHLLVCAVNHVGLDDWSMGVFRRELSRLYAAFAAGEPSPLPEPPVSYGQFCRDQHRRLDGEEGSRERAYWRDRLAGAPLTLQLPIGDPGLPEGDIQPPGGPLSFVVGPELTGRLRALARGERTTAFMVVLSAFSALVARYTGHDDVLVSTVVAGRNRTELEGMIGCFAKKVLVRASVAGNPTVRQLLGQVRAALLGAMAHPELPYEAIVQHVLGEEAAAHGLVPTVNLLFQGVAAPRARFSLPGLEPEPFDEGPPTPRPHFVSARSPRDGEEGGSRAWGDGLYAGTFLAVILVEAEDHMTFTVRGAFHPPTVEHLLRHFQVLLDDAVADPDKAVADLALFGDREWAELAERTQGPAVPAPGDGAEAEGDRQDGQDTAAAVAVAVAVAADDAHLRTACEPTAVVEALAAGEVHAVEVSVAELDALLAAGLLAALAARTEARAAPPSGGHAAHPEPALVVTTPGRVAPERWEQLRGVAGARVVVVLAPPGCDRAVASVVVGEAGPRAVAGRPLPGVACHVLDRAGRPVPVGVVGELHVEAGTVGARPTGELARHLPGGVLELLGRRADNVDLRGFRVDVARVEAALAGRGGVREVAVTLDRSASGSRLVAHVVTAGREAPTPHRLRQLLWSVLPGYACPSVVVRADALPRDDAGGVDRARLPAAPPAPSSGPRATPGSREEAFLAACWAEARGVEEVAPAAGYWQDFSFLAAAAEASRGGEEIRVEELNRARTVEGLAAALAARATGSPPSTLST